MRPGAAIPGASLDWMVTETIDGVLGRAFAPVHICPSVNGAVQLFGLWTSNP